MSSPDVYVAPQVAACKAIHQQTIDARSIFSTVRDFLAAMAKNLEMAFYALEPAAITEINNYHPNYLGKKEAEIRQNELEESDFLLTIAKEYGFLDWPQVEHEGQHPLDLEFEAALDKLLAGDKLALAKMLDDNPSLINKTSSFGHQAQLIHYVGSNGVELWRQIVPLNLVEMTQLLLKKGADPRVVVNVYGGSKVVDLVRTSGHPWEAGVAEGILALL